MLEQGAIGEDVREIQELLNGCGWKPRLEVDGEFGPATEEAVRWFQAAHSDETGAPLEVDGQVGALTLWALRSAASAHPPDVKAPGLAQRALAIARQYHAANVIERPAGSNRGGPSPGMDAKHSVDAIQKPFGLFGQPWCGMAAWQWYTQAGLRLSVNGFASVYGWATWAREHRCIHPAAGHTPEPGDLFLIGPCTSFETGHHIGMVEAYDPATREIVTIEGNCGNRVASLRRPKAGGKGGESSGGGIAYYVRPGE